mgnify:CR=1 FL=1
MFSIAYRSTAAARPQPRQPRWARLGAGICGISLLTGQSTGLCLAGEFTLGDVSKVHGASLLGCELPAASHHTTQQTAVLVRAVMHSITLSMQHQLKAANPIQSRHSGCQSCTRTQYCCHHQPTTSSRQERVKALCEDGTLVPVLDRKYTFDQIAAAHAYVMTGRKRG